MAIDGARSKRPISANLPRVSLGHHIANDAIRDHLLGKGPGREVGPYDIGIIGDYNIGGDALNM